MEDGKDLLLNCLICGTDFFTKGEEKFYKKNRLDMPKRCKSCRDKRKVYFQEKKLERYLASQPFTQIEISEMDLTNPDKTLFIIGNGFDLIHGVSSSYYNFRDFMRPNDELRVALEMYIKRDDLWTDFEESLADLDDDAMLETLEDWTDIFGVKEQHDDDFSAADFFMAAEAAITPAQTIVKELPIYFRKWINTLQPPKSNKPLEQLIHIKSKYINFNYTEFLETIYEVPSKNIFYVHGERRNKNKELILGHSGFTHVEVDMNSDESRNERWMMRNQTTYDLSETANYHLIDYYDSTHKHSNDVIDANKGVFASFSEVEYVVVIGHSLSLVDYPYFKEVINNNSNMTNMKWYISWYSIEDIKRVVSFAKNMDIDTKQIKLIKL